METEYRPWDAERRLTLARTAIQVATSHQNHSDPLSRNNCGACAVRRCTKTEAPDYAGWLRIWIQIGWPVPQQHYNTAIAEAAAENRMLHDAIMRDIATWGIELVPVGAQLGRVRNV